MADQQALELPSAAVQSLANKKAKHFVHHYRLAAHEVEDVCSELVLAFVIAWPRYDAERSSVGTYASRVFDKKLASHLRQRFALSRRLQDASVSSPLVAAVSAAEVQLDFERAIVTLPSEVKATARLLLGASVGEVAKSLKCSRQTVQIRKRKIKAALNAVGIGRQN